ncbi:glycosyltransferase family 4 protein [Saccharicrinis sp. 156]|uniref:glycosyltransferase family 4 protein n=1 Tax=Saccharicrinis sp. 156 TaxID=3417574 RepID=UPI003D3298B6
MNNDMRSICFVIPHFVTFTTGGAEIQVHYLSQAFLKRGWKVEVVCAGLGYEKQISNSPFLNDNIQYHYYRKRSIRILEFWDVLKVLKNTSAHYYYQRTDFALTASTYWYTQKQGKHMVFALALDSDAHKNKYSTYFKAYSYSNIIKKWIRKTDFFLLDKLIEWVKKRVGKVVCQNQYQLQSYKTNFNTLGIVVPNSFSLLEEVDEDKENLILWVGNDSLVKQAHLFIELAKEFGLNRDWHFVMLGSACNSILSEDIPQNLSVVGSVGYQEANQWFARAKVYVNTSLSEGMPNTFIQSWYFKTLILSLNVDPDQVFSRQNVGFSCQGDFDFLRATLQEFIDGHDVSRQLSNGKDYFNKQFNAERNVDKLIEYMES